MVLRDWSDWFTDSGDAYVNVDFGILNPWIGLVPWVLDELIEALQVPPLGRVGPANDVSDLDDSSVIGKEHLVTEVRDADEHTVCPSAARVALVFGLSVRYQSKNRILRNPVLGL